MQKSTEHDTRTTRAQRLALEKIAQSLVEVCVRNALENLHAGIFPSSRTGDYSDVTVVTPYGEIPWTGACQGGCRLSHAAKGWLLMLLKFAVTTESRSGLSVTAPM
jgi:hypothetical protein